MSALDGRRIEAIRIEAEGHRLAGRLEEAERLLSGILDVVPDHHPVLHQAAVLSSLRTRPAEALARFERALQLAPDVALYHRNIGEFYRKQWRLDEATAHARRAMELTPDDPVATYGLSVMLHDRLDTDGAIRSLRRTIELDPAMATAHLGLAELLLLTGRFAEGWAEYEWRFDLPGSKPLLPVGFAPPPWNGRPMRDGRLLLVADQGFGDMIQFARFIPRAAALCPDLVVAGEPMAHPFLAQLAGGWPVVDHWGRIGPVAAYCTLSDLPRLFGVELATIPAPIPYLTADAGRAKRWRERLDAVVPKSYRRVGLVWAGRPTHLNDFNRSIRLPQLARLFTCRDTAFVSLQMGAAQAEIARYYGAAPLVNLGAEIADFSDTMAILDGLDHLVTVDTSVAHLAGAMGRPVSLLLPYTPDWRWLLDRRDSPWYPTVILCRQSRPGDWTGAVEAALASLG